jgi:hypothetical protein
MALLQLNAVPSGMELFPAADDDAWTLIKSVIEDCDYYLLVVGGKYGSVDPVEDISYTEKEYDYAVSCSKPVMAFLHADPDLIPQGKAEKAEEAQRKLAAFRSKVQRMKHVKYWSGPDELAGKVALSLVNLLRITQRSDGSAPTNKLAQRRWRKSMSCASESQKCNSHLIGEDFTPRWDRDSFPRRG